MDTDIANSTWTDTLNVDINRLKKGEVNLGTSIMAVTFADGVILGADSRTSSGSYIVNRVTDKLTQLYGNVWCCRSGSAADTQAVADYVASVMKEQKYSTGREPSTEMAASFMQEICYENKDNLSAGLIVAGYDERSGGSVYAIPLGGSIHRQEYAIGGSGSTFIYGYCNANWRPGMSKDDAISFVKSSLQQAMHWDGSSGGVIRMVVLSKDGIVRHLYLPDQEYEGPGEQPKGSYVSS